MEIQIALDRLALADAVGLAAEVAPLVDWIEFGTSMIKHYGREGLRAVVVAADPTPVLADMKTVDDVMFELSLAFDAGAGSATVLGLAPDVTLDAAVELAAARERELVVDLMGLSTRQTERLADRLPPTVVLSPHVSKDSQVSGQSPVGLLGSWSQGRRIALAGGLRAADLPALRDLPDLRVIVGSAVTGADDPVAAVQELRSAAGRN